jgi:hypothetical protein
VLELFPDIGVLDGRRLFLNTRKSWKRSHSRCDFIPGNIKNHKEPHQASKMVGKRQAFGNQKLPAGEQFVD